MNTKRQGVLSIHLQDLQQAMKCDPISVVKQAETRYSSELVNLCAKAIMENRHIILVAGPSSSGKTTTAKKIAKILKSHGKLAHRISLDDFYLSRDSLPLWPDGTPNYESAEGIDLALLHDLVGRLISSGSAKFPTFDFATGKRAAKTFTLDYTPNTFLIIEGLHALNPLVTIGMGEQVFRVYTSVHSRFVGESNERILGVRQLRLTRRIIRDIVYRNAPVHRTLEMWQKVMDGENLYISPYRSSADIHLDATHCYEPYLYHDTIIKTLADFPTNHPHHTAVMELREAHSHFYQMDKSLIPNNSLVQEFLRTTDNPEF